MKKLLCIMLAAGLCGCITMGRPFDAGRVATIQIGKTSRADLQDMFGEPYRTGLEDGDNTATWLNYELSAFGAQKTRDLYVRFNKNDTVKTYSFNSNMPGDQEAISKAQAR